MAAAMRMLREIIIITIIGFSEESLISSPIVYSSIVTSDDEEEFIARYRRDVEHVGNNNYRQPRFLDFYTCVSSAGTLGMCLPEPYCSYMINGAILDPTPTKGCSHTMLSDYGCCTLPCGASNQVPIIRTALTTPAAPPSPPITNSPATPPPPPPPTLPPRTSSPLPPPKFSPPIIASNSDFSTCGHINTNFKEVSRTDPRDTQLSPTGKWCWQVAIMDSNLTFKCGGTLLNSRHVLTVGHCVQKSLPSSLIVRLGDTNLRASEDNEDLADVRVMKVLVHPGYTGTSPFQNNLAILTLETDAPINRNRICSVCLPAPGITSELESMFYRGSPNGRCVTTGFGKLDTHDEFPLMRMKEVPVPLIATDQCSAILQSFLGARFSLPDIFFCAGGEGLSDGCEYDGGGPLMCPISNGNGGTTYVLTGVVTWGIDCAKVGVPGVYTRVTNYTTWLRDSISTV
ncbi:putative Serine protease 30 [Hypsibius exemplaris]|uniref:Serine protease 30 n=1 Tax=Hypsibius exemplaris TaxID=2072580 RepID=A0A1W0X2B8_HYPEX|nr:putative Serine protease 30 [Hypsibius exemplaris]